MLVAELRVGCRQQGVPACGVSLDASTSVALCAMSGRHWLWIVEPDRRTAYQDEVKVLMEHPVQDELAELVNPLIQTSESVRHLWALG